MKTDAIKIKTVVTQGFVVAGKPFSITTTVTNPHDETIEVIEYFYHIPYQVQWFQDDAINEKYQERIKSSFFRRLFMPSIWRQSASAPGTTMSYMRRPELGPGPIQSIEPGESQSYSFRAIMPSWLFATGGQLTFQGVVIYNRLGQKHSSTFEVTFPFRPPLRSTTIGAIAGALLGTLARFLKQGDSSIISDKPSEAVTATLLAAILAIISVIYSSRRSNDSQPVLTVEDVWGGLLLGFLIGYLGNDIFQKIVPVAK